MLSVLYRSELARPLTQRAVARLGAAAARRHRTAPVTGFLLHHDNVVLHLLEGPRPAVERLLPRRRHGGRAAVEVLHRGPCDPATACRFWGMALHAFEDEALRRSLARQGVTGEAFRERSRDADVALDLVLHAYVNACIAPAAAVPVPRA